MPREELRPIPSRPGYMARSDGVILGKRGAPLRPFRRKDGYLSVPILLSGQRVCGMVHVLVCEAFHGPRPSCRHEAAHWNGVRSECSADNLRWATPAENREDMKRHGTWPKGEAHGRAQITAVQADEIRRRHAAERGARYVKRGFRQRIAAELGVKVSLVKDVIARRTWVA